MVKKDEKLIHWFNEFKQGEKTRKIKSKEVRELNKKFKVSSNYLTALVRVGLVSRVKLGVYKVEKDLDKRTLSSVKKEMSKIMNTCLNKNKKTSVCLYCKATFIQHHKLQKYCPSKFGKKNYCRNNQHSLNKDLKPKFENISQPVKISLFKRFKNWFKSIF